MKEYLSRLLKKIDSFSFLVSGLRNTLKIAKSVFFKTLVSGLLWRFSLIFGYVFSIHAVGHAFNQKHSTHIENVGILDFLSIEILSVLVFSMFLFSSIFDVIYTRMRLTLEASIELFLIKNLDKNPSLNFKEITAARKTYASQVIVRFFDVIYALCLILISFIFITYISIKLSLSLLFVTLIAGIYPILSKRKSKEEELLSKGAKRRIRAKKLVNTAITRGVSTMVAGVFLAVLLIFISQDLLTTMSLPELAIVAFCTRFFVSFFSIFQVNLNLLLGDKVLMREFNSLFEPIFRVYF